jgi:hypothetical protein
MRVDLREFILERNERLARSWITLTARPPKQLPVNAARFMQFSCDYVQPAKSQGIGLKPNIRPPAGHIGGDRDSTYGSGSGDDSGLFGILPCVQQLMIQSIPGKQPAQSFRCLNGSRAHEYRPAYCMYLSNPLHHGIPLFVLRSVNAIGPALASRRPMRWNRCRRQSIYAP